MYNFYMQIDAHQKSMIDDESLKYLSLNFFFAQFAKYHLMNKSKIVKIRLQALQAGLFKISSAVYVQRSL